MRRSMGFFALLCVLLLSAHWADAQTKSVTGKVLDGKDGSPLTGVTVKARGANAATTTDATGAFSLTVPAKTKSVDISYIGFQDQEVAITGAPLSVVMAQSEKSLNEVLVVGYGTSLKRDLTGSVSKVGAKELTNTPVTSFENALQGRAAGVFVEQSNGKVGQGITVRIRGSASVTAGNDPLYVVDGIPLQTDVNLSSNGARTNLLSDLNTNDIESVEILKDASAAAIYGSRGSNGVVLITTKKGKSGKSKIEFGYFTGQQDPTHKRGFMNAEQYVNYFYQAAKGAGVYDFRNNISGYASEKDAIDDYTAFVDSRLTRYSAGNTDYKTFKVNTDWESEAFQKAPISQYDINFSGGNDKTLFFMGGQVLDQTGIIVRNGFKRYSARLNIEHKVRDWLTMGMNMNFVRSINKRVSNDDAFSTPLQIVALSPITPLIDPRTGLTSGALDNNTGRPNTNFPVYYNPLLSVQNGSYNTTVNRTLGNLFANATLTKGLIFRTELGMDQMNQNEENYNGRLTARNSGVPSGSGFYSTDQILNINTNNYFNYKHQFGELHSFDATAGMSYQDWQIASARAEGEQFPSDSYKKLASAASKTNATSTSSAWRLVSYFARANYKFRDKYLLSASVRDDGSSRFGKSNRYGIFPAGSAAWILSEEKFLNNVKWLSFLKLKASYGLTGNSSIPDFASRQLYSGNAAYGGLPGQHPTQLGNDQLKWESTASADVGLEGAVFNNRLSFEVDYYQRNTRDLLLDVTIPGTTGFRSQIQNIGKLKNNGIEVTLNSENVITKNFRWSTSINFAANRNKITYLGGQEIGTLNRAKEGQPLGVFIAREFAGADPANGDALYVKNTKNADGTLDKSTTNDYNEAEDVVIGNPNPDFIYGMRNYFSYKTFDLEVLLQGVQGNELFNGGGQYMSSSGSNGFDNQTLDQLGAWKQKGDVTRVPEARLFFPNGTDNSSRYISDGSYLRVKAITFGYNLPPSILSKIKLDRVRLYFRGQNLFTITNYKGWDPEVTTDYQATTNQDANINRGVDFYSAPQLKTFVFGINIGL